MAGVTPDKKQPPAPPDDPPPSYDVASNPTPVSKPQPRPRGPLPLELPVLQFLRNKRTILASASPRRKQLLAQIGLPNVEVVPSSFAEDIPKTGLSPFEYVLQTASSKALAVYRAEIQRSAQEQQLHGKLLADGAPNTSTEANVGPKGDPELIIAADTIVVGHNGVILEKPRSEKQHIDMLRGLRDGPRGASNGAVSDDPVAALLEGGNAGIGGGIRGEGSGALLGGPVAGAVSTAGAAGTAAKEGMWHKVFTAVAVLAPLESARDPGYALETVVEETGVKFDPNISDEMILSYVRTREGVDKAGGYGIQGMGALLVERINGTWDNVVGLPLRATLQLIEKVLAIAQEDEDAEDDLLGDDD